MADEFPNEFDAVDESAGLTPAADGSTLALLRDRVATAKKKLQLDLEVPRLDPPVFVRFKPPTQKRIEAANELARKLRNQKGGEAVIIANAGLLADVCLGVFEVIDGREVSIDPEDRDGDWLKFGPRLAELLGLKTNKASDVVRALYLTDGDIISTSDKLAVWSGHAAEAFERDTEGN